MARIKHPTEKLTLHLACSTIDRTINIKANAFEKLQKVLMSDNLLTFSWGDANAKTIKVEEIELGLREKGGINQYYFHLEQITEVCPTLGETLNYILKKTPTRPPAEVAKTVVQVWKHCSIAKIPLSLESERECYLNRITKIDDLDVDNNTVIGACLMYDLELAAIRKRKAAGVTEKKMVITSGWETFFEIQNCHIDLILLENVYPGFTARVEAAIAMGLSPSEVANYAQGEITIENEGLSHVASHLPSL